MNAAEHPSLAELDQLDDVLVVRARPRSAVETDIDITPMIDMVFLLLIFFLVTSRIDQQASVDLPGARYGGAISAKAAVVITVAQSGNEVAIYKGDGIGAALRVTAADAAVQEAEIMDYVRAGLAGVAPKQHVLIKAGHDVQHKHVARVLQAVGRVLGDGHLYVAVRETQ